MKRILPLVAVIFFAWGCHSDNDMHYDKAGLKETESENPVGIENVNGNIPDTTNTIDIGNAQTTDSISVAKDSLKFSDDTKK